ncbi:hypothetical protein ACFSUD_11955 [Sulfitobacter aestuarii]|uniref:Uncharacterized protein n=1 Tax=Sulfitobacter aestuarii TaxID=2161676 RepID=A0ABW5U4Z1_9RHOB
MTIALTYPQRARPVPRRDPALYSTRRFLDRQALNAERYLAGLAPIRVEEFGSPAIAPTGAHIAAANALVDELRRALSGDVVAMRRMRDALAAAPEGDIQPFLELKARVYRQTKEGEKLFAFYRGIFDQRSGRFGGRLRGVDRIARNCYQAIWLGLGRARSVPAPQPFAYIEDGNGPATYRRGVKLSKLGKRANPFPLVKIPQHRLHNPWTLGAIPHEVAHNLQNDLGLWQVMPQVITRRMTGRVPPEALAVWARWHKEAFADYAGCLLIGPAYVESLIDVVGRSQRQVAAFNPDGVHPTPILRVPMNCVLLRRMGFADEARAFVTAWHRIYPLRLRRGLPKALRESFDDGATLMVEAICETALPQLGGRSLRHVISFTKKDVAFVREAADRLLRGENTGVLPERYLIAAARRAITRKGADPVAIAGHFYATLGRV